MDRGLEYSEKKRVERKKGTPFWVRGGYFDYQTFFLTFVIVVFGIVMVYSSSSYRGMLYEGSSYYYVLRQGILAIVGLLAMYVASHINYRYFAKLSTILMALAIILCFYVLIAGVSSHGSSRWLNILGFSFQPSELAKVAIIIYMSYICAVEREEITYFGGILKVSLWPVICIGLIAKENLSTAIVCGACLIAILFVASPNTLAVIEFALVLAGIAVLFVLAEGYRGDRIDAWKNPEESDSGYQTMQSLYAIGSGGLFGKGLGASMQKLGFLPESHNDMIFSVVCEELGLFGAFSVIALFVVLILNLRRIANNTSDSFGGFLITGIIAHIASQSIVNLGVVTSILPPTGVTLPFFSYGGSSLLLLLVEMGIALGVARQMKPVRIRR